MIFAVAACTGAPETGDTAPDPTEPVPFEVVADGIPGGTLLSAWSDGDALRMVGGDLSIGGGTTGNLVTADASGWCVDEGVADTTLWWIHGPRAGEWYAVGGAGRIVHEVDGVRADERVPTASTLYGVWAAADGRVWAVGGDVRGTQLGEVWVRDPAAGTWSAFATGLDGVVFKVWDRWFVGDGLLLHLEGDALVPYPGGEDERLLTVRGRADDDVYAVGGEIGPVMLHWDGVRWSPVEVDLRCTSQPLNGVWTAPGAEVWIAGNGGAMGRFDGAAWECPFPPITGESFHAVWEHAGEVYWAGGNLFSPGNNYGTVAHYATPAMGAVAVPACAGR